MDQYDLFLALCRALMLHFLPHFYCNVIIIIIYTHNHPSCSISSSFMDFAQRQFFFKFLHILVAEYELSYTCSVLRNFFISERLNENLILPIHATIEYQHAYFVIFQSKITALIYPFIFHRPSCSVMMHYLHKLRHQKKISPYISYLQDITLLAVIKLDTLQLFKKHYRVKE